MRATIKDIAERSGVGLATVSRVLNGSPLVSDRTREKVLATIADLNYVPSAAARGLSLGRSQNIAVLAPFAFRAAFMERLAGIESVVAGSPYDLLVYNVETAADRDRHYEIVPDSRRAAGVIAISLPPRSSDLTCLAKAPVPVVLLDVNGSAYAGMNRIVINDVEGGRLVAEHLIDLGHRRIGFIGDIPKSGFMFTASQDRLEGFCGALAAAGIGIRKEDCRSGTFGREAARDLAAAMLGTDDRPTAIFAASDTQAMGVLEAGARLGLGVPEDLSVVGYDDIDVADHLGLTTVRQQLFESGRRSVELLLRLIDRPAEAPQTEELPVELVVRRSTAPPRDPRASPDGGGANPGRSDRGVLSELSS